MANETLFPRANLPDPATNWGRTVESALTAVERAVARLDQDNINTNKQQNSSIATLQDNVMVLRTSVERLEAISKSLYVEFNVGITAGAVGFLASPGSDYMLCPTGRLRLTYGGSLNGGQGYFVYQVSGSVSGILYARGNIQANPAQRVAITGGASFTPSGSTSVLISVPTDEVITVSLELYSGLTGTYFAGGSILAEVAP